MAYCEGGFRMNPAIGTGDGTVGRSKPSPRHMADGRQRTAKARKARRKVLWELPVPTKREPEFDPYAVYPPLPRLVRPLFPDAPYDRDEYMSAVETMFDVTGAVGVFLMLTGGALALAFLVQAEFLPMLLVAAFTGLAWLVADVARDVLAARYRAVIMQERGAWLFDEFMTREKSGRLAYRDCAAETR